MPPTLDHIVLLVPHDALQALPSWLTGALTVVPGGQHAGGVTENQLVLFQDGVYIEIIAFVGGSGGDDEDKARRRSHRWGAQLDGHIIDWAISLASLTQKETDDEFKQIQARIHDADAGLAYRDLVAGGRTTPQGVALKWAISSPAVVSEGNKIGPDVTGGVLPFWCLDRTDRNLRVPYATNPELARHPSAAIGVAGVTLHIADSTLLDRLRRVYSVLLDKNESAEKGEWELAVPETLSHGKLPRLKLVLLGDDAKEGAGYGWIELSLFTTCPSQTVSGYFVDGWQIEIRLKHVEQ